MSGRAYLALLLFVPACGSSSSAPADAGVDQRVVDATSASEAAAPDLAADQAVVKPDQTIQPDAKVTPPDAGADANAATPFSNLDWSSSEYMGGFNPHTLKSTLDAAHKLTMSLTSLAGTNPKSCTATLNDPAMSGLLAAATKVSWVAIQGSYTPPGGCGYPGDSGEITLTLHKKGGGTQTVSTKWCNGGSTPGGLPKDFAAFIQAKQQAEKAACPGI